MHSFFHPWWSVDKSHLVKISFMKLATGCLWFHQPCPIQKTSFHSAPPHSRALTFFFFPSSTMFLGLQRRWYVCLLYTWALGSHLFLATNNSALTAVHCKTSFSIQGQEQHCLWHEYLESILTACLFCKTTVSRLPHKPYNLPSHMILIKHAIPGISSLLQSGPQVQAERGWLLRPYTSGDTVTTVGLSWLAGRYCHTVPIDE